MTHPHDYYHHDHCHHGEPELHSRHNSVPFYPDYIANDTDDQLPLLSTIGRGQRGDGLLVDLIEGENEIRLNIRSDRTGDQICETPNLDPGYLRFEYPETPMNEGEATPLTITHIRNGREHRSYTLEIPSGAHGSRIYVYDGRVDLRDDDTYIISTEKLNATSLNWRGMPAPRPGDIGILSAIHGIDTYVLFGYIAETNETNTIIVAKAKMNPITPIIKVETGTVQSVPFGRPVKVTATFDGDVMTTFLDFEIPEGKPAPMLNLQPGIKTEQSLPDINRVDELTAFIVDDGDGQYDMYIKGKDATQWTIVENWQGTPGHSLHIITTDSLKNIDIGDIAVIYDYEYQGTAGDTIAVGDFIMDSLCNVGKVTDVYKRPSGLIGVSDHIEVVKFAQQSFQWSRIEDKPAVYPPAAHDHDDRYYTKDQVNDSLALVQGAIDGIENDFDSLSSTYYTKAEVDELIANVIAAIPGAQSFNSLGSDTINSMFEGE